MKARTGVLLLVVSKLLDIGSTELALLHGGVEVNPIVGLFGLSPLISMLIFGSMAVITITVFVEVFVRVLPGVDDGLIRLGGYSAPAVIWTALAVWNTVQVVMLYPTIAMIVFIQVIAVVSVIGFVYGMIEVVSMPRVTREEMVEE